MSRPSRSRSGWWAAPAAALIAVAAIGSSLTVSGAPDAEDHTFVPVAPCRLVDTRPDYNVGPRSSPIGSNDPVAFTVWDIGDFDSECEIPTTANAISTNTTIVQPTAWSDLVLYPADEPTPNASNLNFGPGQAPTPNAVTIPLSDAGQFKVWNRYGTVHVIIDINGYYQRRRITSEDIVNGTIRWWDIADETITSGEIEDDSLYSWDLKDEAGITAKTSNGVTTLPTPLGTDTIVIEKSIESPTSGYLVVTASGTFELLTTGLDQVSCSINRNTSAIGTFQFGAHDAGSASSITSKGMIPFSSTRFFDVASAQTDNLVLSCERTLGNVSIWDPSLTVMFFPTSYGV